MRIQARRLAPDGVTHQSVAAAGVDVERRAPDRNVNPHSDAAGTAANGPVGRRSQTRESGAASPEATAFLASAIPTPESGAWHGQANLRFARVGDGLSRHQGSASAPLKIQRGFAKADGRCELPLLHTAGGLVGGDRLSITAHLEPGSRALLTSVAAQKVYGSIGRSRRHPEGAWALQELAFQLEEAPTWSGFPRSWCSTPMLSTNSAPE